jgi:hypothetical protein
VLDSIRAGRMPFNEAGTQELLDRVMSTGRFELTDRAADAARAQDIVITIGTPSFSHIESDLRQVRAAVDDWLAAQTAAVAVAEIPLLFETGGEERFDRVVVVTAPPEVREARRGAVAEREGRLVPEEEKVRRADFCYVNDGSLEQLDAFVAGVLEELRPSP